MLLLQYVATYLYDLYAMPLSTFSLLEYRHYYNPLSAVRTTQPITITQIFNHSLYRAQMNSKF